MWFIAIFIVLCLGIQIYAFRQISNLKNRVEYVKKLSHRVIDKVVCERRVIELQCLLSFAFFVSLGVIFMHFCMEEQNVWYFLCAAGLLLVQSLFTVLLVKSIKLSQRISDLWKKGYDKNSLLYEKQRVFLWALMLFIYTKIDTFILQKGVLLLDKLSIIWWNNP